MFVTSLRCFGCRSAFPAVPESCLCPSCGLGAAEDPGILDVQYDYAEAGASLLSRGRIQSDRQDLFRYLPLLPVGEPGPVLPTGWTPLAPAHRLALAGLLRLAEQESLAGRTAVLAITGGRPDNH